MTGGVTTVPPSTGSAPGGDEHLVEWAITQDLELGEIAKTSPLPHQPNRKAINQICITMLDASFA